MKRVPPVFSAAPLRGRTSALRAVRGTAVVAFAALTIAGCVGELPDDADTDTTTSTTTTTTTTSMPDATSGDLSDDTADPSDATESDATTSDDATNPPGDTVGDSTDTVVGPGEVTVVLVGDDGQPVAGATVAFGIDADAQMAETDGTGEAVLEASGPGWLTVDGTSILGERILISMADVSPGERIELRSPRADEVDPTPLGTISVRADVANSVPNATRLVMSNACASQAGGLLLDVSMPVDTSCATPSGATGLLVTATGGEGSAVAFGVFEEIALGDTLEFFELRDPPRSVGVSVTNLPGDVLLARLNPFLEVGAARVALPPPPMPLDPNSLEIASTFQVPGDADLPMDYSFSLRYGTDTQDNSQILEFDGRLSLESIAIDVSRDLLPQIVSASADLSSPPGLVSYELSGPGIERADAVLHMLQWSGATGTRRWAVIAAPDVAPELELPTVPEVFAGQTPPEGVDVEVQITAVDVSYHTGWAGARLLPIELFGDIDVSSFGGEFSRATTAFNFLD